MGNRKAIVLGGTVPHIELIRQLQTRGYYVVLLDYLPDPPAKPYADEHIQESTLDKDKVLEVAQEVGAELVIAVCVDHANSTACYVMEKLGHHVPYSYKASITLTNKSEMKRIMWENGIPTAEYQIVSSLEEEVTVPFPAVVKPVDSNGSRGIHRVENEVELRNCIDQAIKSSRSHKAIVERYLIGTEASIYTYALKGKAHVILTNERHTILDEETGAMPGFSASYPCQAAEEVRGRIQEICDRAVIAFGLNNTPLMLQIMICPDDVYVLELMPRIGGGQSYRNIISLTGFDMVSAAIDSYEGKFPKIEFHEPERYSTTNNVYTRSGTFDRVLYLEQLKEEGIIDDFHILRSSGTEIENDFSTGNRVCTFLVSDTDWSVVLKKIKITMDTIDVVDTEGASMMCRDIYIHEEGKRY